MPSGSSTCARGSCRWFTIGLPRQALGAQHRIAAARARFAGEGFIAFACNAAAAAIRGASR